MNIFSQCTLVLVATNDIVPLNVVKQYRESVSFSHPLYNPYHNVFPLSIPLPALPLASISEKLKRRYSIRKLIQYD